MIGVEINGRGVALHSAIRGCEIAIELRNRRRVDGVEDGRP